MDVTTHGLSLCLSASLSVSAYLSLSCMEQVRSQIAAWTVQPPYSPRSTPPPLLVTARSSCLRVPAPVNKSLYHCHSSDSRPTKRFFRRPGTFAIGKTLSLHANSVLFGVSRSTTTLCVHESWQPTEGVATMIETEANSDATTFLGFIQLAGDPHASISHPVPHICLKVRLIYLAQCAVWVVAPPAAAPRCTLLR